MTDMVSVVTIGICDDDKSIIAALEPVLERMMTELGLRYAITSFDNPEDLMAYPHAKIDVLFLDVEMPQMSGFEVAEIINAQRTDTKIVFLTRHRHFVQRAFKLRAYRYLYKPYSEEEIEETLRDAMREISDNDGVLVRDVSGNEYFVHFRNVLYIESMGDVSMLCMDDNFVTTNWSLRQWQSKLDERFCRCHRSFIINLQRVVRITANSVILRDVRQEIPMSVRSKGETRAAFEQYVRENARYM